MYNITKYCIEKAVHKCIEQNKRYAGHSKWQNIRHTKGAKDTEKSILFAQYAKRIKLAIAEGKSTKPNINVKLAHIIEEAKKKSMPLTTINGLIEKAESSKSNAQSHLVDFRGPGNSLFILRILTDNIKSMKILLNGVFKKTSCSPTDGKSINAFDHHGSIITEAKKDLDTATNDAITVGAEDVEEIEENGKSYRFTCHPDHLAKVTSHLKNLHYKIITADENFIPRSITNLNDDDLKKVDILYQKLNAFEEIVSINHNIDFSHDDDDDKMNIESKQ